MESRPQKTPPFRLQTGKLRANLTQRVFSCRYVRAGRVRGSGNALSNIIIEPGALSAAAAQGLFTGKSVFVDHAGFFDYPSLHNLAGVTQNVSWNPSDQAIEGQIKLYDTGTGAAMANLFDQVLVDEDPPDVGLSIVFYPQWAPRDDHDDPRRIVGIKHVESVDLVFEPAADGRVLQALSALSQKEASHRPLNDPISQYPTPDDSHPHAQAALHGDIMSAALQGDIMSPAIPQTDRGAVPSAGIHIDRSAGQPPTLIPNYPPPDPVAVPQTGRGAVPGAGIHIDRSAGRPPELIPNNSSLGANPMTEELTTPTEEQEPTPTPPVEAAPAIETPKPDPADSWLRALSVSTTQAIISASGLPAESQAHLLANEYLSPTEVQSAIDRERAYLASLQENNVIQVGGVAPRAGQVSGLSNSLDQIREAFEALLNGTTPKSARPLSGIRELYTLLSGDYDMTGVFQPDRIQFANVTTSTMANLTADLLNKRVMAEFQNYPQWWAPIVNIEDFNSLQDAKWIVLGGVGELPTVAEGAAYTELTWDDQKESDSFVKKGGYLGLTIEAIDKDDTGRLRAAPRALAQAAWLTLSKSISNIFTSNSGVGPTLSDSLALFHSTHGNLGTSALSVSSYAAARTAMRKMTEVNSSERLGALTAPKFLLVPPDLEITALQVLASEYDYTYALSNAPAGPANAFAEGDEFNARMNFARSRVIVVDLWTDTNNWAASGDPRLYPTIGLGFRYGRVPEVFSVASPTAGLMFTNDTMPVKVRYFFAAGPVDYRNLYKANVA